MTPNPNEASNLARKLRKLAAHDDMLNNGEWLEQAAALLDRATDERIAELEKLCEHYDARNYALQRERDAAIASRESAESLLTHTAPQQPLLDRRATDEGEAEPTIAQIVAAFNASRCFQSDISGDHVKAIYKAMRRAAPDGDSVRVPRALIDDVAGILRGEGYEADSKELAGYLLAAPTPRDASSATSEAVAAACEMQNAIEHLEPYVYADNHGTYRALCDAGDKFVKALEAHPAQQQRQPQGDKENDDV